MIIAALDIDPIRMLLVISGLLSVGCGVALLAGRAERRRVAPRETPPMLEIGSASSILARANATALERSTASKPRIEPKRPLVIPVPGHDGRSPDGSPQDRARMHSEAAAIVMHVAEHNPERMAEVITQWIRTNENGSSFGNR